MFKYNLPHQTAMVVDIASALENVFNTYIKPQLKSIGNLGFTVITFVLFISLIFRGVFAYQDYKNDNAKDVKWRSLFIHFVCLIVAASASLWSWTVIGW